MPGDDDGRGPGLPGPPDDGSRPLPGDEESPPNSDTCADERRAVREAQDEVARLEQSLTELREDYEETLKKIQALREQIRELEAAAREEAASGATPSPPKPDVDEDGKIKKPSKLDMLMFLLEITLLPRIANRGENASLAARARRELHLLEETLPIIQQAIEDTTKRLQEAKAALAGAKEALRACEGAEA